MAICMWVLNCLLGTHPRPKHGNLHQNTSKHEAFLSILFYCRPKSSPPVAHEVVKIFKGTCPVVNKSICTFTTVSSIKLNYVSLSKLRSGNLSPSSNDQI